MKFFQTNKLAKFILFQLIMVIIFSLIYYFIDDNNFNNMGPTYLDNLYFSFITFASIGYGDITPNTPLAKILVIIQSMLLISNIFVGTL
jgi:voltage-gated potassium channel